MYPKTIREALFRASSFLSDAQIKDSAFVAELIIRSYLGLDRTALLTRLSDPMPEEAWQGIERWLDRRASGEPVQYIIGEQDFYGESFWVRPGVLIPRPETEILVEQVLIEGDRIFGSLPIRVIDLGTGSGAIALTVSRLRPHWQVYALDLSDLALETARVNAKRLGVSERIRFIRGNMMDIEKAVASQFEIIISNPPYIPTLEIESLEVQVKDHEPKMALDGGEDGLLFYRGIAEQLPKLLAPSGMVAFEVGISQARDVVQILEKLAGIAKTKIIPDFQGIDRVVLGFR